ncbi:MAG: hypothetical protein JRJ87_21905 [Deltaproteobacteria bacterium]|nr:hypothetical protein [Deltaproteobacteria bacterium]
MRRYIFFLIVVMLPVQTWAQDEDSSSPGLDLVPLVNTKAPKVAVWFVADPKISLDDASALEGQMYEDFYKRSDIQLLSREKTFDLLGKSGKPKLQECKGDDLCLIRIGRAIKVSRIVGVSMEDVDGNYNIVLKSFNLEVDPPSQLNSVVEGSLTDLLIGGSGGAIAAIFENSDQYAPVDMAALTAAEKKESPPVVAEKKPPKPEPIKVEEPSPKPKVVKAPEPIVHKLKSAPAPKEDIVAVAPARPSFLRRHMWSAVALGTSLATLGTGIAFGVLGQDIADEQGTQYNSSRDGTGRDYTLTANVMFGLAGAAAITSVILFFFVEDDAPETSNVSILPSGAGVQALVRF